MHSTTSLLTLALVNADTDELVPGYEDLLANDSIDLSGLDLSQFSIKAMVNPNHASASAVESVKFESSLGTQIESFLPYAMFGDKSGDLHGKALETGSFSLKATAYSENRAKGDALGTVDLSLSVVNTALSSDMEPTPEPSAEPIPDPVMTPESPTAPEPTLNPAPSGASTDGLQLGTNLSGIADWATSYPFTNFFKNARKWITHPERGGWSTNEYDKLDLDENGYPKSLEGGEFTSVGTFFPNAPIFHQYIILYDGEGTIEVPLRGTIDEAASRPGRLVVNTPPGESENVHLRITETDPNGTGNYIRNIRVTPAEYEDVVDTQLFNPDYVSSFEGMNVLRFMDWMKTNGSEQGKWGDRPQLTDANWSQEGVPLEVMVALANETGIDPWFNMPHQATDEYIRNFAQYVKENLDPDLKPYVELSNEVWNWSFEQSRYAQNQAKQYFGDAGNGWMQWYGKRTAEMTQIWDEVYGAESDRVVGILGAQAAWTGPVNGALQGIEASGYTLESAGIDAVAIAPYFGLNLGNEQVAVLEDWVAQGQDYALDQLFKEVMDGGVMPNGRAGGSIAHAGNLIQTYVELANEQGLELVAYEGGQHIAPKHNGMENNQTIVDLFIAANRDPRMGDAYRAYFTQWDELTDGALFANFSDIGRASKWGSWGVRESLYEENTPKFDAIQDILEANTSSTGGTAEPVDSTDGESTEGGSSSEGHFAGEEAESTDSDSFDSNSSDSEGSTADQGSDSEGSTSENSTADEDTTDGEGATANEGSTANENVTDGETPDSGSPDGEAETSAPLLSFALVNAATDDVVPGYENLSANRTIDLNGLDLSQYSIKAMVNSAHASASTVESVKFESSLGTKVENIEPYALFGDRTGNFHGRPLEPGSFSLKATAYTGDRARGKSLETIDLSFTVIDTTPASTPDLDSESSPSLDPVSESDTPSTGSTPSDVTDGLSSDGNGTPGIPEGEQDSPTKGPCPVTGGPVCNCGKNKKEDEAEKDEVTDSSTPDMDGHSGHDMSDGDSSDTDSSDTDSSDTDSPDTDSPDTDSSDTDMPNGDMTHSDDMSHENDGSDGSSDIDMSDSGDMTHGDDMSHGENVSDSDSSDTDMPDTDMSHGDDMSHGGDMPHSGGTSNPESPMENPHAGHDDHIAELADPSKHGDHMALMDLVPLDAATHTAVKNGSWFDASTWAGGVVPGENARVVIPKGITVDYDGISDAEIFTLRVDGRLDFATDQNTQMKIDTFVVAPSGTLTIGSELNPVLAGVETRIIIADNGAIDTTWDPKQLSRGIVSHGAVEIHGAEKTTHLKLAQDAMAGDSQLVLAEVPEGWQVGDRLVLTGTKFVRDQWNGSKMVWQGTQDEELTIKEIRGNTIILNESLQYDHDTPKDHLKASVANYSRNIIIETENHENLPASQRGHVMFMHSDEVDVRYVEFNELGRTDKSKLIDDFKMENGRRVLDADGNPIKNDPEDITNQRGRYAVHFHRTGVDHPNSEAAIAIGNSVWGSPGWGYAHHDSHLIMEDNAAYNVFGSAFVTETGNETGAWRNNIAIKSEGMRSISKSGDRVNNQDIAHNGTGFWFQGRLVENEGNIAAGQRHGGFTYLMRGVDQMEVLAKNVPNPEIARYEDALNVGKPPISDFRDNEVIASGMGLEVIKANPRQGHDVRSVIDGFSAWEVRTGTHLEYTSKYTLKDIYVIGAESGASGGIEFGNNAEDMVVNRAYVEGFKTGVEFKKKHTFDDFNGDWQYTLVDTELVDNTTNFENLDPAKDKILTGSDLVAGRLSFTPDANADFVFSPDRNDRKVVITGTKTDSIGDVELPTGSDSLVFKHGSLKTKVQEGYFEDAKGTRFFTVEELFADRATGDLLKHEYVITLTDDWNQFTLGGTLRDVPVLGTYDGVVEPGLITPELDTWIDQTIGASNSHSDAPHGDEHSSMYDSVTPSPMENASTSDASNGQAPEDMPLDDAASSNPAPDDPASDSPLTTGQSMSDTPDLDANPIESSAFANKVLELTNQFRLENGRSPLSFNQDLAEAAQDHATDMAQDDFFSHTGADGSSILDRTIDAGYAPLAVGENIAAGQTTPEEVVQAWINSPGHRANLLNETFEELGVGYEFLKNDTGTVNYNHYWAQAFGQSQEGSSTDTAVLSETVGASANPTAINLAELNAYGGSRQTTATALKTTLSGSNTAVKLEGNGWQKLGVNYTITPETMLRFEFRSGAEGEIHSIGFDNDNAISQGDRQNSFQLFGVQDWGNSDFATYMAGAGWQSFEIPVGEYLQGEMAYLTFGNDQDIANPTAEGEFRNIMLYEKGVGLGEQPIEEQDQLIGTDSLMTVAALEANEGAIAL